MSLVLKGGISLKKTKKKKKSKKRKRDKTSDDSDPRKQTKTNASSSSSSSSSQPTPFKRSEGTGRILTSGSTVYGKDTLFFVEVKIGDALLVKHPKSFKEEIRVVKMILSDISMALSSGFSSDLISNQKFIVLQKPKLSEKELKAAQERAMNVKTAKGDAVVAGAYGTYGSSGVPGSKVTMRVKSGSAYGGYKIVTINADKQLSRSDMLNLRVKQKGDRMAM
jgi:hypothetical protein